MNFRSVIWSAFVIAFAVVVGCFMTAAKKDTSADGRIQLTEANSLTLRGVVDDESMGELIKQMQTRGGKDLYLYIYSPGGDIMAGQRLIEAMKSYPGHITCVADVAISMAFIVFQNCETRLTFPTGVLMQHEASYSIKGDAPHNLSYIAWLTRVLRRLDDQQAKRIGISYEDFKKHTAVDWWQDGNEAVANHVADGFTGVTCSKELTEKTTKQTVREFIFTAELTWSGCPLIHSPQSVKVSSFMGHDEEEVNKALIDYVSAITDFTSNTDQYQGALRKFERIR